MLTDTRLDGSSGLLTWFGAPPSRTLTFTVGNVGTGAIEDPVFQVGAAHGVFAPQWDEQQWRGTIGPGRKALVKLPVELAAGRARRLHGLPAVRREGPRRAALGRGPSLGRDPVLDPALPGRAGRGVPRRHGGGGPGAARAARPGGASRVVPAPPAAATGPARRPRGRAAFPRRTGHRPGPDPAVVHPGHRSGPGRSALRTARRQPDESYESHESPESHNHDDSHDSHDSDDSGTKGSTMKSHVTANGPPGQAGAAAAALVARRGGRPAGRGRRARPGRRGVVSRPMRAAPASASTRVNGTTKVEITAPATAKVGDTVERRLEVHAGRVEEPRHHRSARRTRSSRPAPSRRPARRPPTSRCRGRGRTRRSPRAARWCCPT